MSTDTASSLARETHDDLDASPAHEGMYQSAVEHLRNVAGGRLRGGHAPSEPAPPDPERPSAPPSSLPASQAQPARNAAWLLVAALAVGGGAAAYVRFGRHLGLPGFSADPRSLWGLALPAQLAVTGCAVAALVALAAACRSIRIRLRWRLEDVMTVMAAGVATAVAMNGMWVFFGQKLHFSGPERALTFAFIEFAMMASAVRARRSMREIKQQGVDGIAVWFLAAASGVLASLAATGPAVAVFRLFAPLLAAWLWHRGLALELRRSTGKRINWRVSPERMLVLLGLAEATARTSGDVDAHRRISRLAAAAKRSHDLRAGGAPAWRQHIAIWSLDRAMAAAVQHAELTSSPDRQDALIAQLGALHGAAGLAQLLPPAPWAGHPGAIASPEGDGGGTEQPRRRRRRRRQRSEDLTSFDELAAGISDSLADDALQEVHDTLTGRDDYAGLAQWLSRRQKTGDKRLMYLVALYAVGSLASPAAVRDWILGNVTSPGSIDKADIRKVAQRIRPVWPSVSGPGDQSELPAGSADEKSDTDDDRSPE